MKRVKKALGLAAMGLLCLLPLQGIAAEPQAAPGSQAEAQGSPAEDGGALLLRYEDGRLSAEVDNRSLRDVAAALAKQLPIKVYTKESIKAEMSETTVFSKFEDLPLHSGLRDLFRARNFVLKDTRSSSSDGGESGGGSAGEQPIEIWFYDGTGGYSELAADGEAGAVDPPGLLAGLGGEDGAGLADLSEQDLRDLARDASSEAVRGHALIELGNRVENPENVDAFVSSLEDDSNKVRWRALSQILGVQQDLDDDVFRRVIDQDPDPFLRKQALAMLVFKKRHGAEGILAELRGSQDQRISDYAQELTEWLAQQQPVSKP